MDSRFYDAAIKNDLRPDNPVVGVKPPKDKCTR